MACFSTQISDDTMMLIEAETSGAFSKSDLEIKPNPLLAFLQSIDAIGRLATVVGNGLRPSMESSGAQAEVTFGIKIDGAGSVMIAKEAHACQLQVTLKFGRT